MRRCIIHFGLHKTGSSAIQEALFASNLGSDHAYIHFETPYIGRKLMTAFCHPPHSRGVSGTDQKLARLALQCLIQSSTKSCLIISSEDLSRFREDELSDFIDFLRSNNLMVEALAYVRDYQSWCESLFQQSVKYGNWGTSLFPFGIDAYRFSIEKFDRLLGRENVTLRYYDRALFHDQCVVKDFFRRLNIRECPNATVEVNNGLCLEAVKFLRALNASSIRPIANTSDMIARYWLVYYIRRMKGNRVNFHSELISERIKLVASDLDWIERRLGKSVINEKNSNSDMSSIRNEADLETFSAESLEWLSRESGEPLLSCADGRRLSFDVARSMVSLQDKISSNPQFQKAPHMFVGAVPRIIWTFWSQGRVNAPPLVQKCFESWQEMNPNWSLRVLDEREASTYLSRAAIPPKRLDAMRIEIKSDLLRMRLLYEHGGIWTDATNFCLQPLDSWVLECMGGGFFAFRDAAPFVMVSSWLLAASRNSKIAKFWLDELETFWAAGDFLPHGNYPGHKAMELPPLQRTLLQVFHKIFDRNTRTTDLWFHPVVRLVFRSYPYCVMLYLFSRGYRCNSEWRDLADQMPYRPAGPILAPYKLVEDGKSFNQIVKFGQNQNLPLLKFNWKKTPYDFEKAVA